MSTLRQVKYLDNIKKLLEKVLLEVDAARDDLMETLVDAAPEPRKLKKTEQEAPAVASQPVTEVQKPEPKKRGRKPKPKPEVVVDNSAVPGISFEKETIEVVRKEEKPASNMDFFNSLSEFE